MSEIEIEVQVATVAKELHDLVGWPTPDKLISLRALCSLDSVREQLPSDPFPDAIATAVWTEIRAATRGLTGEYSFNISTKPVTVSAEQVRQGYSWLLRLNNEGGDANQRRQECIDVLGLTRRLAVRTWRGEPELNFMRILARQLLQRNSRASFAGSFEIVRSDQLFIFDEGGRSRVSHFRRWRCLLPVWFRTALRFECHRGQAGTRRGAGGS